VSRPDERYLVVTEHGRVLVVVRGDKDGLDPDLIEVGSASGADDLSLETPLRAFAAKMVDLVQARGEGAATLSPTMAAMMVKEKAAEDLRRIERAARRLAGPDAGPDAGRSDR
jgi:hypothetical protein